MKDVDVNDVLEILTEQLTNERLDTIALQDSNYQDILKRLDVACEELQKTANHQTFEEFNTIQNEQAALYAKIAYQQGMKDIARFFISLIPEPAFKS